MRPDRTTLTGRCARLACCAIASLVVLWPAAAPAAGQITPKTAASAVRPVSGAEPLANKQAVVTPELILKDTQVDVPTIAEADQQAAQTGTDPVDVQVTGNAALQDRTSKRVEYDRDCQATPTPTSPMLATGGVVVSEDDDTWGTVLLLVAAAAALLLVVAIVRRVRTAGARKPEHGLERIATVVAIVSGALGIVVTFVPGVAGSERPAQEATMDVREVHPRITRNDFALATHTSRRGISTTDRQEVGNVVWLEIALRGYAKKHPVLQYGLYQFKGEVLLPNTAKEVPIQVADADAQTSFVPIWVGYPSRELFQAQFRLLVDGRVRQMAKTGRMSGSTDRYACAG